MGGYIPEDDKRRAGHIILTAVCVVIVALVLEAYLGFSRYKINSVSYRVPHKYEFMGSGGTPLLLGAQGLDKEPNESIWLLFPAPQLTRGVPGYQRRFRGYLDQVEADMVVNVLGGKEAREFPADRRADLRKVSKQLTRRGARRIDAMTGWDRVYWLNGEKGTPSDGHALFYLIPHAGLGRLPSDWRVPHCQSSPDVNRQEIYHCHVTIYRGGLTFQFYIVSENLPVANHIPTYTRARLNAWRG